MGIMPYLYYYSYYFLHYFSFLVLVKTYPCTPVGGMISLRQKDNLVGTVVKYDLVR